MKTLKDQIIERFLQNKSKDYILQEGEQELINLMEDVIKGLQEDLKYAQDQNKRILNEKLNLEEHVEELREQLEKLKGEW